MIFLIFVHNSFEVCGDKDEIAAHVGKLADKLIEMYPVQGAQQHSYVKTTGDQPGEKPTVEGWIAESINAILSGFTNISREDFNELDIDELNEMVFFFF